MYTKQKIHQIIAPPPPPYPWISAHIAFLFLNSTVQEQDLHA